MKRERRHFIVKHGLEDFELMPNYIWRTGQVEEPLRYGGVKKGDRWISFAYTTSDRRERTLRMVTGFYECTHELMREYLPAKAAKIYGREKAWMIQGMPYKRKPKGPVGIPPINELLEHNTFQNQALIPITPDEFEKVQKYVLKHEWDHSTIPLLGREPRNEAETLAIALACYEKIGIEKILRIRAAFPDLLVKLKGRLEPVHLEVETYSSSFCLHGHHGHVRNRCFHCDEQSERRPVAVLCWIHDAKKNANLTGCVHQVIELQHLLRSKERISWLK